MSTIDGVKIWFEDNSAILVRPSGTEPVYRLYAEAKSRKSIKANKDYTLTVKKSSPLFPASLCLKWRILVHARCPTFETRRNRYEEKREKYAVSVIGCKQKGILYAIAFAEVGFKVICTDADQTLVKHLAKGKTLFHDREIESN